MANTKAKSAVDPNIALSFLNNFLEKIILDDTQISNVYGELKVNSKA